MTHEKKEKCEKKQKCEKKESLFEKVEEELAEPLVELDGKEEFPTPPITKEEI